MREEQTPSCKICLFGRLRVESDSGEVTYADGSLIWSDLAIAAFASGERAFIAEFSSATWEATRKRIRLAGPRLKELGIELKCSGISCQSSKKNPGVYVYFAERVRTDYDDVEQMLSTNGFRSPDKLTEAQAYLTEGLCPELRQKPRPKWVQKKEHALLERLRGLAQTTDSFEKQPDGTSFSISASGEDSDTSKQPSGQPELNLGVPGFAPETAAGPENLGHPTTHDRSARSLVGSRLAYLFLFAVPLVTLTGLFLPKVLANNSLPHHPTAPAASPIVPYAAQFSTVSGFQPGTASLTEVDPGEVVACTVAVKNVGSQPWKRAFRPISLGVLNGNPPTNENRKGIGPVSIVWNYTGQHPWSQADDFDRAYLGRDEEIDLGQTKSFRFGLKMPSEPGPYPVTFQMVMDGPDIAAPPSSDGWFAGQVLTAYFQVRDRPLPPPYHMVEQISGWFSSQRQKSIATFYNSENAGVQLWTFAASAGSQGTMTPTLSNLNLSSWRTDAMKVVSGDFNGDGYTDIAVFYKTGKFGQPGTRLYIFRGSKDGLQAPTDSGIDLSDWTWESIKAVSGRFGYGTGPADDIAVFYQIGTTSSRIWVFPGSEKGARKPLIAPVDLSRWTWEAINPAVGHFKGTSYSEIAVVYRTGASGTRVWLLSGSKRGLTTPTIASQDPRLMWEAIKPVAAKLSPGSTHDDLMFVCQSDTSPRPATHLVWFRGTSDGLSSPNLLRDMADLTWDAITPTSGDFFGEGTDSIAFLCKTGLPKKPGTRMWLSRANGGTLNSPVDVWDGPWIWENIHG